MTFDIIHNGVGIYYDIWGGVRCELTDAVFDSMKAVKKYIDKVERKERKVGKGFRWSNVSTIYKPIDPAQLELFPVISQPL